MKKYVVSLSMLVVIMVVSGNAQSATLNNPVNYVPGYQSHIYNVADWETSGNTMGGLDVTAVFMDPNSGVVTSQTYDWVNGDGVLATNWSLTLSLEAGYLPPFIGPYQANEWHEFVDWNLDYTTAVNEDDILMGLILDGSDSNLVFDVVLPLGGADDTPGSKNGRVIEVDSGVANLLVTATYSNEVALKMPDGTYKVWSDLYKSLSLDFSGSPFVAGGDSLVFSLDVDNVNVSVPEPATMLLMGLGLSGLIGSGIRRRRKVN